MTPVLVRLSLDPISCVRSIARTSPQVVQPYRTTLLTPLDHRQSHAPTFLGLCAALLLHALLLLGVLPWFLPDAQHIEREVEQMLAENKKEDKEPEDFPEEMKVVLRTVEFFEPEEMLEPPEPEEEEEQEEKPLEERIEIDKKTVEQVNNEDEPVEANFVSEQANKTDRETRATETTMRDVVPTNDPMEETPTEDSGSPDPDVERSDRDEDPEETQQELAMSIKKEDPVEPELLPPNPQEQVEQPDSTTPEESDQPERPPSEDGLFKPSSSSQKEREQRDTPGSTQKKVDPRKLFAGPSIKDYERVMGKEADSPKEDGKKKGKERRRLLANYAEKQKLIKGSLENMITEIQPGNHTSVNAKRSVYVGYINAIHRRIHERWANEYLISLDTSYPRSSPLQDPDLNTTLEFVIDAKSGEFEAINIVKTSGEILFDAEAISTSWNIGKRPNPPPQIVSPNGKIYVHWNFWRDGRQCGVMSASIYLLNKTEDGQLIKEETAMPD